MRLRGWLVVLCVVTLATLVTLVVTDLRRELDQRTAAAERHMSALAWTLEEQALRTFESADVLLRDVVAAARDAAASDGTLPASIPSALVRNIELVGHVSSVLLLDIDGLVVADSTDGRYVGTALSDCGCFYRGDGVHVDLPTLGGAPSISLSRQIALADGTFVGTAVAVVDAGYLESFYSGVRVGDGGIIGLLRQDGLMLAQSPRGSIPPGTSAAGHPVFEMMRAGGRFGMAQTRDPLVDFEILVSWRNFEELPMLLTVSAEHDEVLAGWAERRARSLVWLSAITLAVFMLVVYLWVQIGKNLRTQRDLVVQTSYFRQLFQASPEGIVILDNGDRVVDANQVFQETFGYMVNELRGRLLNELILPPHLHDEASQLSRQVLENQTVHAETVRARKDGSLVHVSILGVPVRLHDDQVGVYGIYRDIGNRIAAQQELRESEERYRIIAEQTGQVVYDYDVISGAIKWTGAIRKITGYDPEEFQGMDIDAWAGSIHPEDREDALQLLEEARKACSAYHAEYRMRHRSGIWLFIEDNGVFVRDDSGVVHRMLGTLSDITERKRISSEMAWQATHDTLTGLVNRHEFEERVARLLFNRRGRHRHALLYIDLDQFKVVNDTCGHQAGDQLLRQLTGLLAATVRETDTLARLGGDEFGLMLVDCPLDQAVGIAEKLIMTVNEFRFSWDDQVFNIGASIGLVEITSHTDSVAMLFSAADSACYAAKDKGRNQVVVYNEGDEDLAARHGEMTWVSRITKALQENRFELYWQPIRRVAAHDDGSDRYELLIRMRDESGALIGPDQFINAAERYNLMPQIDRWVVREAFRQIASRPAGQLMVSINLSGTTLSSERFITFVHDELARTGINPQSICYEITETAAIANLERARQFIREMHTLGCKISLDDFGSGLSSFAYLKSLKVDYIKIDGAFVKDIADDQADQAMVEAIVRVGQIMGVRSVAEFVESAAILEALTAMGVDYAQGYFIGRPQPFDGG